MKAKIKNRQNDDLPVDGLELNIVGNYIFIYSITV